MEFSTLIIQKNYIIMRIDSQKHMKIWQKYCLYNTSIEGKKIFVSIIVNVPKNALKVMNFKVFGKYN